MDMSIVIRSAGRYLISRDSRLVFFTSREAAEKFVAQRRLGVVSYCAPINIFQLYVDLQLRGLLPDPWAIPDLEDPGFAWKCAKD